MKFTFNSKSMHDTLVFRGEITRTEILQVMDRDIMEKVSEKLADDLYNKYKDELLSKITRKQLLKAFYKKLEIKLNTAINKMLKLEK